MRIQHLALVATFAAAPAFAQAGKGSVTGIVTDAQGKALQGARITVTPGNATAATDAQGQYTFTGLEGGALTLTATYQGFKQASRQVTVLASQSSRVDLSLAIASDAQSVDVYAGREGGEIEAINRTINADNVINVLPADVIISLPNANVADAIGRLPSVVLERDEGEGKYIKVRGTEPRLNHTTLDGISLASPEANRQIKLDLIPADLVESVQVNKTLEASMEGDGIGGSVDLRTKTAQNQPTVYVESTGGYTPILGGRPAYQFDGTLGKRFLPNGKLGLLVSASYDWNGRGINDIEPGPAVTGTYDLRDYRYFRNRKGLGGTVDYRFSDTSSIYLKYLYSRFDNFGDDWIYTPQINGFANNINGPSFTQGDNSGTVSFSALRRRPIQDIGGIQLGGHQLIKNSAFAWDLDASVGRTRDQGYDIAHFAPVDPNNKLSQGITYGLDLSNPLSPHINVQDGNNIFDPTQYSYQYQTVNNLYNPEVDLGFGASLLTPYTFAGHASTFEFGGRFRNEHKFENQSNISIYPNQTTFAPNSKGRMVATYSADPSLQMTNFLNDFSDPNYYGGNYQFGPAVDYDKVLAFQGQHDFGMNDVVGNSFNQREKVSAGYLMNTTNLGKFRVVLGIRIEATNENNQGYLGATRSTGTGTQAVILPGSYINALPSASVRYSLTPASSIRLVYSRGLARPQFSDLIPFQSPPNGGTARNTITQGNPNLHAEIGDDIDVLYDNALPHQGLLQAGFFYKHLSSPLLPTQASSHPTRLSPATTCRTSRPRPSTPAVLMCTALRSPSSSALPSSPACSMGSEPRPTMASLRPRRICLPTLIQPSPTFPSAPSADPTVDRKGLILRSSARLQTASTSPPPTIKRISPYVSA